MIGRDRRREPAIALGIAIAVLVLSPGLAVVALVAIFVLVACGVSLVLEHRHH